MCQEQSKMFLTMIVCLLWIGNKVLEYSISVHRRKVYRKKQKQKTPELPTTVKISNSEKFTDEMLCWDLLQKKLVERVKVYIDNTRLLTVDTGW